MPFSFDDALGNVTDPGYVQAFMEKHKVELDFYHSQLHLDNGNYDFHEEFLINNATAVRDELYKN